ncbi:hypothetical protein [Desulfocastanea catecholica]
MPLANILINGLPDRTLTQPNAVEVVEAVGEWTVFRLEYNLTLDNEDMPLLTEERLGPDSAIAIQVRDGDAFAVLVNGPVTQQKIQLYTGGEGSSLQVMGGDLRITMAREHRVKVWPTTTDSGAVLDILSNYEVMPLVVLPSTVVHTESKNTLTQRETDWHFVNRIAERNGCWFWLTYDPVLALASAHIKRPPVDETPVLDLYLSGSNRNIETFSLQWNTERTVSVSSQAMDLATLDAMDGAADRSPLTSLASLSFADIAASSQKGQLSVPIDDAGDLIVRSEAALIEASWFVQAQVSVRYSVLSQVIRSHTVVNVHGVGVRHSGKYLVSRVAHQITDDDHVMVADLIRNGWNA